MPTQRCDSVKTCDSILCNCDDISSLVSANVESISLCSRCLVLCNSTTTRPFTCSADGNTHRLSGFALAATVLHFSARSQCGPRPILLVFTPNMTTFAHIVAAGDRDSTGVGQSARPAGLMKAFGVFLQVCGVMFALLCIPAFFSFATRLFSTWQLTGPILVEFFLYVGWVSVGVVFWYTGRALRRRSKRHKV